MIIRKTIAPIALVLSLGLPAITGVHAQDAGQFETPESAVAAVIDALHNRSVDDLIKTFGPGSKEVLLTGEAPRDRAAWTEFLKLYDQANFINIVYGDIAVLFVGPDNLAFPVPMMRDEDGYWTFDVEEGREEILTRRIGRNELDVIEILEDYVLAQAEFRAGDYDGDGVMEFASSILSSPGEKDGLYWADGYSPYGSFFAQAAADGYSLNGEDHDPVPFSGYYFRLLSSQGPDAPGGAMDYTVNGHQVGGHAMLAVPASYGDTGIMSFLVSENGIVMEADLGEDTLEKVRDMFTYNPDENWQPIN